MKQDDLDKIRQRALQVLTIDGADLCANDVLKLLEYIKELEDSVHYWRGVAIYG